MDGDTVLVLGNNDPKLHKFLSKMGFCIRSEASSAALKDVVGKEILDLIILDSRFDLQLTDLLQYFRGDENTKKVPVLCIYEQAHELRELKELKLDKVDFVSAASSVGVVASKIATQIRLGKWAGTNSRDASIAEVNSALRDVNRRHSRELNQARAIQQGLLPKVLPKQDSFDVAASYQPLEEVGGDWYFAQMYPSGKLALQIADVTGHGLSAAFLGSMTKLAMCAAAKEAPDELLKAMNRLITPQLPEERFVTMASVVFDPESGSIEFARAGHPPGLLVHRDTSTIEELRGEGFALGFFDDGDYSLVKSTLKAGDLLVLITDGIIEGQNRSFENYGSARLNEVLLRTPARDSAEDALKAILDDFNRFTDGRRLKDDVTLIVLKRVK